MNTKYERDIYLFLSLYRFVAYGLAVVIIQVVPSTDPATTPLQTYLLIATVGIYTLLKVLGPLRWWQQDPMTYVVLGGDLMVSILVLLLTGGLNSGFLLYSLTPVITAALLFSERFALAAAAIASLALTGAHLVLSHWFATFPWIMQGNYLLWLIVYATSSLLIASVVYRTNLNIRSRIETDAILEERRRMRREIHDGVAQALSYLSLKADTVSRWLSTQDIPRALAAVAEMRHTVEEAHKDIQESLNQLSVEVGLAPLLPTLRDYVGQFGQENSLQAQFEAPALSTHLSAAAELQVLRIALEALANVRKHSRATSVWVKLVSSPTTVELAVKDNGQGFLPAESARNGPGHHGLKVMQERAQSVGGTLTVTTAPGQGTEVRVTVPVRKGRR